MYPAHAVNTYGRHMW